MDLEPRYRRMAHAIRPSYVTQRLPSLSPRLRLCDLMRRQLRRFRPNLTPFAIARAPASLYLPDPLRDRCQHVQKVTGAPREPIQPRHYQHIPALRAASALARAARSVLAPDCFSLNTRSAPRLQGRDLRIQRLPITERRPRRPDRTRRASSRPFFLPNVGIALWFGPKRRKEEA
jgi:hypothetical protein